METKSKYQNFSVEGRPEKISPTKRKNKKGLDCENSSQRSE